MNPYFTRKSFNDVVFDQRHKQYGAYVLRSRYNELILRAFFWLMGTVLLLGFTPSALRMLGFLADGRKIEVKEPNVNPLETHEIVLPPIVEEKIISCGGGAKAVTQPLLDIPPAIRAVDSIPPKKEEPIEKPKSDEGTITVRNNPGTDGPDTKLPDGPGTSGSIASAFGTKVDSFAEYHAAQVEPKFPKGNDRIQPWIVANISHSQIDRMELSGGTVYVTFVVERDGSVSNVAILKGLESVIDKEAIRLIKSMPKWEPGRNSDVPVRVRLNLPIKIHRDAD